ncbi:hypothetical protein F4805DRAFT_41418 [Annulohypoxylon moriforme]|nr:hypothetical protein F4805DRAFT_41418 [Annulohypoxylon moriforme]
MLCRRPTGVTKTGCGFPCCKSRRDETGCMHSKYCKKHTCSHFYKHDESPRCDKSKDPNDSVCINHRKCPVLNCNKAKIEVQICTNELRFRRERYCSDHECSVEGCHEERKTLGGGEIRYTLYCVNHTCVVDRCTEQRTGSLLWCNKHKCKKGNCSSLVVSNRQYCEAHNRCDWPSCSNSKQAGKEYCTTHLQCETDGCENLKDFDSHSSHCSYHTCHERQCNNSSGDYDYCNRHRCECEGCGEHKAIRLGECRYCPRHSCQRDHCLERRCCRGVYCARHSCMGDGCGNVRDHGDFCESHWQSNYENSRGHCWDDERRRLRSDLEIRDAAIEEQRNRIRQQEEQIRRLQSGRCGGHGPPN